MRILALDIATVTGWATETASGTWNLKPNRGESDGMRVIRFKAKVKEIIKAEEIDLIVYERQAGRNTYSIMIASEMVGVLKGLCINNGIEYASYSAGEIKRFATGKGNASKEMMIESARGQFDCEIVDDNHADALWLLKMVTEEMG